MRCVWDYQFPRASQTAFSSHVGILFQSFRLNYSSRELCCGYRIILSHVEPRLREIADSSFRPMQSHEGGSNSLSLPQLASHLTTFA